MHKLLVKIFIKNYKNTEDPKIRSKYGTLSGIIGIITNLLLAITKIILGIISFSVGIVADGINNLSDSLSSVITIIGFKLSAEPADAKHPFGHERIEYITGLIISFIILMIAVTLGKESVMKLIENKHTMEISYVILGIMTLSVLVKCWQGVFYKKMAKAIDSEALGANSIDSFNDCLSTGAVIVSMIIYLVTDGKVSIDGYAGIFVAIFIMISGIKLCKDTISPLLGEAPSSALINELAEKITQYDGVLGIHDLVIHNYGPNKNFASVHVEVASDVPIMISHDQMDNIEHDIKKEMNIDLTIHMDPIDIKNEKVLSLKKIITDIVTTYDKSLSIHDFRVVFGVTHNNVLFDLVLPLKYFKTPAEVRCEIISLIKEYDQTLNPIIEIDQAYEHNL